MIKCNKEGLHLDGTPTELMAELTMTIRGIHQCFTEGIGEEAAKKAIAKCGRLAYMDVEPLEKYHDEIEEALNSGDSERIKALRKKITEELEELGEAYE